MWFARGVLRALFALLATTAILWVSWRTSGMPSWPRRITWWVVMLGLLRSTQLAVRAFERAQRWDSSDPPMTESVMLAVAVAVGALLTTGLLSSAATHQMTLEPYERLGVAVGSAPPETQITPSITTTTPTIAPSAPASPAPPAPIPTDEPVTAPLVAAESTVPAPTVPVAPPAPADVALATISVNTPAILTLAGATPVEPGRTLTVSSTQHGQATAIGTDAVMFLPERDYLGSASITYERCDANHACAIRLISLTVG